MNSSDLFDNPSAMLRWLEMPEGQTFLQHVSDLMGLSMSKLEKESDIVEIYRRQGRLVALGDIRNLPNELRQVIKRKVA